MTTSTWSLRALGVLLLAVGLSALPTPEDSTLATELRPPPLTDVNASNEEGGEHHFAIFVINLYGVKNETGASDDELFQNELVEHEPSLLEPLATVLLVLEDDGSNSTSDKPVDLDEFARELEKDGLTVDKIKDGDETKLIRVKLDGKNAPGMAGSKEADDMLKVRRKRTICLKCKRGGGGGGRGYNGGGGGGCGGGCGSPCGGGGCGGGGGGGQYYGGYPGGMMSDPSDGMMGYGAGGGCQGCSTQPNTMMGSMAHPAAAMQPVMASSYGMVGSNNGMMVQANAMMMPNGMSAPSNTMMHATATGCVGGCGNGAAMHPSSGMMPAGMMPAGMMSAGMMPGGMMHASAGAGMMQGMMHASAASMMTNGAGAHPSAGQQSGNGGGQSQTIGVIPVVVVPVAVQGGGGGGGHPRPQMHPQQQMHPQGGGGGCNTCGYGGGGGGGSYAQASASAQAQAGAGSWGKK